MVMGVDSCSEDRGFEFQHCILERHFVTSICCKIYVCLKKTENKRKRGRGWPIKKILNGIGS